MSLLSTTTTLFSIVRMSGRRRKNPAKPKQTQNNAVGGFGASERKEPLWRCAQGCGACCKLAKGADFASPEEIFTQQSDIQLYRSMIGQDGWCVHYVKATRTCSIYSDRPYFCRVESDVFQTLYGIQAKSFNKEACRSCRDTIKEVYGPDSEELVNYNRVITS